jgi:hypothetical protein
MYKSLSAQFLPFSVSTTKNYLILFMLCPFLAFITALVNYSQKEARKVVYLFLIYYGFSFVISGDIFVDALAYAVKLKNNAALPFSDFFKIVGGIYATDTSVDIVEPLISFIVSRFTSNHGVYFAVWAAIFGFFYLKSIDKLYDRYQNNRGWNALIFMVLFIVIIPITDLNSVRMWTAAWIFFYGAYYVILYHDSRYLLLTFVSVLIHWSFLTANLILLIYFLVGNRNYIYFPLALISFILPNLIAPFFKTASFRLGGALQGRFDMYSNQSYILERKEAMQQNAWFLHLGEDLVFYYLLLLIIVIQFRQKNLPKEKTEKNLYSFLLLFLAFVNFGKALPSFGGRFQILFFLFAILYVFIYYLKLPNKNITFLPLIGLIPMALYAAVKFREGADSISAWLFTPGFITPLFAPALSLANLLFN